MTNLQWPMTNGHQTFVPSGIHWSFSTAAPCPPICLFLLLFQSILVTSSLRLCVANRWDWHHAKSESRTVIIAAGSVNPQEFAKSAKLACIPCPSLPISDHGIAD